MKKGSHDYSVSLEEGEQMYEDATLRALAGIEGSGLSLPPRPLDKGSEYFDGRLPSNISSLSNLEIGHIHAMMCQHADYVHSLLVQAKADILNTQEKLKLVKALVRKSKTGTVQEKEDLTITDIRYVEANERWIEAKTFTALMEGLAEASSRDLKFLSRMIETKRIEIEMNRRDTNIPFRHKRYRDNE